MRHRLLTDANGLRVFVVVLSSGEDPCDVLLRIAREQDVTAASLTAIGAMRDVTLGFFDWERKDYERIAIAEQVEVLSMMGDITLAPAGSPQLHVHAVVGKRDGSAHGGHLLGGVVRPTLEVVVTEAPSHLRRQPDAESGLALIAP